MKVTGAANCLIEQPVPNLFRIREVTSYLARDLYPHCDFRGFPKSLQENACIIYLDEVITVSFHIPGSSQFIIIPIICVSHILPAS